MPKPKLIPVPSAAFHILLALADEDLHGYAIMRSVSELTGGKVRMGPGTLHGSIKTLLESRSKRSRNVQIRKWDLNAAATIG